jgi:hypothetical protein
VKRFLFLFLLTGCAISSPPTSTPMSGIGKVLDTGFSYPSITIQYEDGQLVKYHLCDIDHTPVREGMTVNISFKWSYSGDCFNIKDAYREQDLEDK